MVEQILTKTLMVKVVAAAATGEVQVLLIAAIHLKHIEVVEQVEHHIYLDTLVV